MGVRPNIDLWFPPKVIEWDGGLFQACRFKILYGGRGSAKSHTIAQYLILKAVGERHTILCARQVQKSIRKSSKALIEKWIKKMGLSAYFDIQREVIRCITTGSTFEFSGLQDHTADSLKSFEGVTICWVEEAHAVTAEAWNVLIPTIRESGSEIIATFNPQRASDYVWDRFVAHVDPDAWVCKLNWRDNPWFPKELETERLKLKALNADLYEHIYEGALRSVAGLLFKRKWFNWYTPAELPKIDTFYMASDYAGAPDPEDPDSDPDFTEHGVGGLNSQGNLYLTDWFSEQCDANVWIPGAIKLIRKRNVRVWFEEKGIILRSQDSTIRKALRMRKASVFRKPLASAGSKAERALGFAGMASLGQVYVPRGTPWAERLVNQLCDFTGEDGKVDDGVDVCSLLARGMDSMKNAREPEPVEDLGTPGSYAYLDNYERREAERKKRFFR